MKVTTFEAPSHWAPYLINGDSSGMESEEAAIIDSWIESIGMGLPVSCEDAGFCRSHDAWSHHPYSGDCQTYAFLS